MSQPNPSVTELPPDDEFARRLGVSLEAVQLLRSSEVIDLHIDTFIPVRLWGYDPFRRHGGGVFRGRFFGHLDVPRAVEGGLTGAMWSITTNPLRGAGGRWRVFERNLKRFRAVVEASGGRLRLARNHREYREARAAGAHATMLAIQGGNALQAAPEGPASIPDDLVIRVTLVHLTNSVYGATSSPLAFSRREAGLTDRGRELVAALNAARIFVDLAHINRRGFWDAVEVHDRSQPLIATHTGVCGVKPHWRNLDDQQLKAIADTGGTVGIIYSQEFLRPRGGPKDAAMVVDHLEHVVRTVGEDFASIGTDYDGAIVPPPDLRTGDTYVRLVQHMLDRGWTADRIRKILGTNFLRAFAQLRP